MRRVLDFQSTGVSRPIHIMLFLIIFISTVFGECEEKSCREFVLDLNGTVNKTSDQYCWANKRYQQWAKVQSRRSIPAPRLIQMEDHELKSNFPEGTQVYKPGKEYKIYLCQVTYRTSKMLA